MDANKNDNHSLGGLDTDPARGVALPVDYLTYKFFVNTIPCSIERKPKRSRRVIVGCWSAEA